jgi:nucleotide-binding universal stress UspA family protein
MNYKTILVHIDQGKHSEKRLKVAIQLAKQYDAYLIGCYVFSPHIPADYIMTHIKAELEATEDKIAFASMARAEEVFRKQTSAAGLEKIEWHTAYEELASAISLRAQYADLVLIGQSDTADELRLPMDFPERLVLAAARPVLILPTAGDFPTIGKRILVAWNASQEATRAVSNATPFLRAADSVYVMAVNSKTSKHNSIQSENMVQYLERLGVHAQLKDVHNVEIDVGNALLSSVSDLAADLIVMGCYGHSRLREWVLGGATRTILDSMTVPVLMSH